MNNHETSNSLAQERTVLAAERTYSAWLRTAIAAMAGGVAILRLISFKTDLHRIIAHAIGEILILWGFVVVLLASIDYKKLQRKLHGAQNYKTSTMGFLVIALPLLLIGALLIWVTLP